MYDTLKKFFLGIEFMGVASDFWWIRSGRLLAKTSLLAKTTETLWNLANSKSVSKVLGTFAAQLS